MTGWREVRVEDVAVVYDGPHATPVSPKTATSGPVFLGISSLKAGRLDLTQSGFLSESDFERWTRRVTPQAADVVFSYETRLGQAGIVPAGLRCALGRRLALMRPDQRVIDPRFLLYSYLGPKFQETIRRNTVAGSTVDRLMLRDFPRFPLLLPSMNEQRGIGATLGALDDKIESNWRLIEKLQHMSVTSFRAWRSSCTDIVATTFGDFCDVYGGSTPRTDEPRNWGGPHWWATPTDLTALPAPYLFSTSRTVSEHGLTSCSAALHPPGTIFMTSRATIGAFAVNQEACATNQGFICARPRHDRDRWFLFEEMRMRVPEMLDRANGSTFLELSRRNFKEMTVQVPSEKDRDRLRDEVEPLHRLAAQRSQESQGLAALRDALLPELLSGRIRVPEASTI